MTYPKIFVLQLRLRVEVMLFFGLCLVLLWLVKLNSCASQMFVSLGIMPMQVNSLRQLCIQVKCADS